MNHASNSDVVCCALYLRSATGDRASLLAQEEACRAAAARQTPAWQVVEDAVFSDAATSGLTSHNRPGLDRLLERATERPRPFDYVLVESSAQLGRNLTVYMQIVDTLGRHGVGIYSASLDLDSSNPKFRDPFVLSQWGEDQMAARVDARLKKTKR